MMNKYELSDCSIIVPIQIDSLERLEHITFLHSYFHRHFKNHKLFIVEYGKEPKIRLSLFANERIEFVKGDEAFSSAQISNIGASLVETSFFCKVDADTLIHPKAIFDAFEKLKGSDTSFVLPFNRVCFDVLDPLRKGVMQSLDLDTLPFIARQEASKWTCGGMRLRHKDTTGLIHLFRTSVFKDLGGYNEEFIGWGYEDDEIVVRFKKLNHPQEVLEKYTAFHLDHPREIHILVNKTRNYQRLLAIKGMSEDRLIEYIKTWSRFDSLSN